MTTSIGETPSKRKITSTVSPEVTPSKPSKKVRIQISKTCGICGEGNWK
jgi:hypothetical protein